MKTPTIDLLVIQPTPFCNLACTYCYLSDKDDRSRIGDDTLERIFARVFESPFVGESMTVVWHAGEPTVLPIAFYRRAFATAARHAEGRTRLSHSFQTNATLIDDEWCAFIAESGLRIGVSIDGPAFLHNARRKDRLGRGSFDRVMRGVETLKRHRLSFHVITVLTRASLAHADELYDFYVSHGIDRVGFNLEETEGENREASLDGDDMAGEVRAFFGRFHDLVREGGNRISVREFAGIEGAIFRPAASDDLGHENTPFRILNVDCRGNFSTFSPELLGAKSERYADFLLGNVADVTLEDAFNGPALARQFDDLRAGLDLCRTTCEYFDLCRGASPSNKFFENGTLASSETRHCKLSRQALADVVIERLERA